MTRVPTMPRGGPPPPGPPDPGNRLSGLRGTGLTLRYPRARGRDAGPRGHEVPDAVTNAVTDAELSLAPGSVHGLVGPNGSGKSTLLRALARLHPVSAGDVLLDEESALPLSAKAFARRVTMLGQTRPVPTGVTVRDVVGYGRHPYRGRWRAGDPEGPEAIEHAMRITGVRAMADRGVDTLSGGERQRVWVATALAQHTGVLLLDEPTTYLDLRYQVEILDLIRDLADSHGVAIGVVLHDLNQAAAVADHVTLLADGRVAVSGDPVEVLTSDALGRAYGIDIDVRPDPVTGLLTCHPLGRHNTTPRTSRARLAPLSSPAFTNTA